MSEDTRGLHMRRRLPHMDGMGPSVLVATFWMYVPMEMYIDT